MKHRRRAHNRCGAHSLVSLSVCGFAALIFAAVPFTADVRAEPGGPETPTAEALSDRGMERFLREDYQGAVAELSAALRLKPYDTLARQRRALAHTALGEYQKALEDLTEGVRMAPDSANLHRQRGELRMSGLKDYAGAITDFDRVLLLRPDDIRSYYNRAIAKTTLKAYREAITDYTSALKVRPDDAKCYYGRGYVRALTGELPEARRDWLAAAAIYSRIGATLEYSEVIRALEKLK